MEQHPYGRGYSRKSYLTMATIGLKRTAAEARGQLWMAEGVGFEPTVQSPV